MDIRLDTRVDSLTDGHVVLSDGEEFDAETIVWTAGVKANPMLTRTDLPLDEQGPADAARPTCGSTACEDAWGAGDCAAVPDLTNPGAFTGPSAQHAVRQTKTLAANIVAALRQREPRSTGTSTSARSPASASTAASPRCTGSSCAASWPGSCTARTTCRRMPTLNRKVRVLADWTLAIFFPREVVSLGQLQQPRREFELAALPDPARAPLPGSAREAG